MPPPAVNGLWPEWQGLKEGPAFYWQRNEDG